MMRKPAALCAVLLLVMCLPAAVSAGQPFAISAPEHIGVGQPFLARISSPHVLSDVEFFWDGKGASVEVDESGHSAVGMFGAGLLDKPGWRFLEVQARSQGEVRRLRKLVHVVDHQYPEEVLTVAPRLIKPPKKYHAKIARERKLSRNALETYTPVRYWNAPFSLPVKGKKLSRFGLRRTFNGEAKRRHWGLDFRAYLGTPLHAIAPGKVILVGRNFYYAGNCVYIDHGNGVISFSCHMSKVLVKEGQMVKRGQAIGLSGATGRVTGAHLHLAVIAQGVAVDPEPLFEMNEAVEE